MAVEHGKKFFFGLRGSKLRSAQIWAVIMPAYLLFGYNNAIGGQLLDVPSFIKTFPKLDTTNTTGAVKAENSRIQGTVVALYTLGCFFGALSCIWVGDRLGRRRTIQLGALIDIVGVILQCSSYSLPQLIIGRLVAGLGFGALTATAPNWQSECSSADHRGAAVLFESVFISAGLAICGWISLGMSFTSGDVAWRFPLALSLVFAITVILTTPLFPESPRWLIKHGRSEEAKAALSALEDRDASSIEVRGQFDEITESLEITGAATFSDIFKNGEQRLFHRTCLAAAGQIFQQMSGINALAFYVTTIFHDYLGLPSIDARVLGSSVFTWQTLCSPIGILTVDRFGRRKLMLVAAFGMGSCMAIVAGTSSQKNNIHAVAAAGAFIFMFSLFFPTGFLGLTFLYAAEISPLSVRVPITSISTGTAWLFNFVVAEITPTSFATIGWRYYIVYACINFFLIFPCVYFFWPETAGRQLEEVDQIFRESKNIFDPVKVSRMMPRESLMDFETHRGEKTNMQAVEKIDRV